MKTLQDIKDEYARAIGFSNWNDLLKHQVTIKAIRRDYEALANKMINDKKCKLPDHSIPNALIGFFI